MEKLHREVRLMRSWTASTPGEQAAAKETAALERFDHSHTSSQERLSNVVPSMAIGSWLG